ncbi:MAG TPA: peptidylprolyl isomerase [Candidatus Krumholzibacteria bacterium]|nr:peptidylprolyl isomerase [Candidatus Krumholzibacteria bacterium]HRX50844.1 peptidylprolyl isomerase [Candidatus Krumholzibacteria bacterium]
MRSILTPAAALRLAPGLVFCVLAAAAAAQEAPAPVLVDRIVAIVDEEAVLQSDLDREVALYYLEARNSGAEVNQDEKQVRDEVLQRLIESKLIIAAARLEEIEISDDAVEREVQGNIDQLVRYYGSEQALEQELVRNGMTMADYRKRARGQLRDQHYMRAVLNRFIRPKVEVREDEVDDWYADHGDEVPATPDSLTLADILIPVEPPADVQRDVQRKLGAVLQKLGDGAAFADVARELSEGPMASRGGRIGPIKRGELYSQALEDAVFRLPVGQVSQPVVSERGVHIVKVDAAEGETRTVSQIFFPLTITEDDVNRAKAHAEAVHARLLAGEAFGAVAAQESADPVSAGQGGELGTFALTDLSPTIQEALADVQPGGVTRPFLTPAGFYIFLVRDRQAGHVFSLEEVRPQVRQAVEGEKIEAELTRYVADLRRRFVVDVKD